jgi:uncharacterized membrane protein YgcG
LRAAIALSAALAVFAALAQSRPRDLPPLMRTVSDEVGVLTADEGLKLARVLEHIREEDGIRVVLVIAKTVQPGLIEDYVERLSRRWAADGAIDPTRAIFVVVAVEDRELVVMPGRALSIESALSSPDVTRELAPLFRARRYFEALMTLAERVHEVVHGVR